MISESQARKLKKPECSMNRLIFGIFRLIFFNGIPIMSAVFSSPDPTQKKSDSSSRPQAFPLSFAPLFYNTL